MGARYPARGLHEMSRTLQDLFVARKSGFRRALPGKLTANPATSGFADGCNGFEIRSETGDRFP